DVRAYVMAEIVWRLTRHVVDVSQIIVETGHRPPEAELVRESGRALETERRAHGALLFLQRDVGRTEVARRVELRDLGVERGERGTQLLGRGLAADRDRPRVIELVVFRDHRVPEPRVDEAALESRAVLVHDVREH